MSDESSALRHFLEAQRAGVPAILQGLTEDQLRTPVLPSGWTPLGLVEHLGHAERHWFQEVAQGTAKPLPWTDEPTTAETAFTSNHPTPEVMAFYRTQCELSDAVLASTPLDARPLGRHDEDIEDEITDLRWIVLHMIEETARHLGHLDTARELLDGRTGLSPR
ncbi:DinB family protein [Streptomyces sp. NPDC050264]|uniref:DinB family protein n=1 Tax=Streptomyces sp. NPDC050264 TaxID=3155038 RepID=UPI00343210BE